MTNLILIRMTGILSPVLGALAYNLGSVAVIINSALLLNFHSKWIPYFLQTVPISSIWNCL